MPITSLHCIVYISMYLSNYRGVYVFQWAAVEEVGRRLEFEEGEGELTPHLLSQHGTQSLQPLVSNILFPMAVIIKEISYY